ncbi:TonB-dependent receptor plug domain-containing protein [Stutzerimonas frequens]|uniref:TonB-dependent receptor plug domain-containing protein n=1 Tax=Stutzerimonas frequens TaxID=2968969 RepID=UPI00210FF557|nr:TonB-dependent receptor plug domain-containing protein [Stutzerimonas frequens]
MQHCPIPLSLLGSLSFAALLSTSPCQAQPDQPLELGGTEVTASHVQGDSVEAEQLQHYQAADLQDVFESSPEVSVGGGPGVAQKLYLRGFEDTLLNISIDGASQPGQTFHHTGRIGIEPELLKRAEVQAGTGDATSGPGALGGSIRFVTKDPDDLLRPGERAGALLKGDISAALRVTRPAPACSEGLQTTGPHWRSPVTRTRTTTKTATGAMCSAPERANSWGSPSWSAG